MGPTSIWTFRKPAKSDKGDPSISNKCLSGLSPNEKGSDILSMSLINKVSLWRGVGESAFTSLSAVELLEF
jgi:hypothetical protein